MEATSVIESVRLLVLPEKKGPRAESWLDTLRSDGVEAHADIAEGLGGLAQRVQTENYDAVLSGLQIDGGTGIEAAAALRRSGDETPLVLVSPGMDEEAVVEAVEAGVSAIVPAGQLHRLPEKLRQAVAARRDLHTAHCARLRLRALEAVLEACPLAIVALNPKGNVTMWNPGAGKLFGWRADEVIGQPPPMIPEGHGVESQQGLGAQLKGAVIAGAELQRKKKDGTLAEVSLWTAPLSGDRDCIGGVMAIYVDISERKIAEGRLQAMRFALDHAGDGCFWVTQDGRIAYVNEAACQSLGYSREELLTMSIPDISGEITGETWPVHWDRIRVRHAFTFESIHRRKDGAVYPVEISVNYVKHGEREYDCAFVRDITERKRAEEKLRRAHDELEARVRERTAELSLSNDVLQAEVNERRRLLRQITAQRQLFQTVVDHAPAGIAVLDGQSLRLKWSNPAFRNALDEQHREVDVTGMKVQEVLKGADKVGILAIFRDAAAMRKTYVNPELEWTGFARGTTYWRLIVVPLPALEGEAPDLMLVAAEITESVVARKRLEEMAEQLAADRRFLRTILNNIPIVVAYFDRDLVFRNCNVEAAAQMGVDAEEVIGKPMEAVVRKNPEIVAVARRVVATGEAYSNPDFLLESSKHPEEPVRHFLVAVLPDKDDSGAVKGGFSVGLDMTQEKHAAEKIQQLNQYLERRSSELAAINTQLELRNREVERANRLKSEFLATMSHELRTPLNAIIGFSDLLAEQKVGSLAPKQERFLGHIRQGAKHLLALINDILDLSKIEAGRLELQKETFAAGAATLEVLTTIRPLALAKQIQVESAIPEEIEVHADRIRFKQILYNLLSNAVKYTPPAGRVRISAQVAEGMVRLSVDDTGIGIPASERESIFDEFHQVSVTTKGVKEGTGLGLAIARRLVRQHGGDITVTSKVATGSCFTFTLPVMNVKTVDTPSEPDWPRPPSRERPLVMIVDDELAARELLTSYLAPEGYDTVSVESAAEALERARELRPDAITLDALMPGKSGWTALEELKSDPATASIPVIVISVADEKKRGLALGAAAYLLKPVSQGAVLGALGLLVRAGER